MKVSNVGSAKGVSSAKRAKKTSGSGAAFAEELEGAMGAAGPAPVSETQMVSSVDAVLALQGAGDATEERSRGLRLMQQYGDDVLDRLEAIRREMLTGGVSKERLTDLARILRAQRKRTDDPRLNAVIDAIELRAEVELAKLTRNP